MSYMIIWLKNVIRSLKDRPLIYKTEKAIVQIRYITSPWKEYAAKIVDDKEFNEVFYHDIFKVFVAGEVVYIPDLVISNSKISELLCSDRLFYKEEWYDPEKKSYIWTKWYKL